MISKSEILVLLDQLDAAESRAAHLAEENAALRGQIDFLLRSRMDAKSLEAEARKPLHAKTILSVEHAGDGPSPSSRDLCRSCASATRQPR